jgi:hypothetical protein
VSRSRLVYDRMPSLLAMKRKADQLVEADPKVISARRNWASCMRVSGWQFADPDDPQAELIARFNTFDSSNQVGSPDGNPPVATTLTDPAISQAASIEGSRRASFVDDRTCSIPLNETYEQVRQLVEQQLLRSPSAGWLASEEPVNMKQRLRAVLLRSVPVGLFTGN